MSTGDIEFDGIHFVTLRPPSPITYEYDSELPEQIWTKTVQNAYNEFLMINKLKP